ARDDGVGGPAERAACAVLAQDAIAEARRGAAQLEHAGLHGDPLVVARAVDVATADVQDRQQHAVLLLHLAIAASQRAQHLGAAELEPAQLLYVAGPAHLIGVGIAHAHLESMHHASSRRVEATASGTWTA